MEGDNVFVLRLWRERGAEPEAAALRANVRHVNSGVIRHAAGSANLCTLLSQWLCEVTRGDVGGAG